MKTVSEKVWLAAVGLIVLYSVYPNGVVSAEKISIDGLDPLSPRSGDEVTPTVSGKRLEISLPDQPPIRVEGWPAFLPQEFAAQKVEASRLIHPSGPADLIAFTRMTEQRPWLLAGTGSTPASKLVGDWKLQFTGKEWSLSNGEEEKPLRTVNKPARPTIVAHGKERWCVYLLSFDLLAAQSGQAPEGEARASWAAVRLSSGKRHDAE